MRIRFVRSEDLDKRFFVVRQIEGDISPKIMSAFEIFRMMDLADLYDIEIRVYKIGALNDPPKLCKFRGTWHDPSDPLKMVIECDGKEIAEGYGTDH